LGVYNNISRGISMFSRFKVPTISYCELAKSMKRELTANLQSKGVTVRNLEIAVNKTAVNISLHISESSTK
jgi:hypothetical protein